MPVSGYPNRTSVAPRGSITFHLGRASGRTADETIVIENISDPSIRRERRVTISRQSAPRHEPWMGFNWPGTDTFFVPRDWPSGLYRVTHGTGREKTNVLTFVVRPPTGRATSRVLVHISYLRAAAYNSAGGKSFYKGAPDRDDDVDAPDGNRARKVSLLRPSPYPRIAHDREPDAYIDAAKLLVWLKEERIAVDCCSSIELHTDAALLDRYDCLVLTHHDEYWTKTMRDRVERFVQRGGNLIVLSGNTCFRQVRLEDRNTTVVFYKYASVDPLATEKPEEAAIAWAHPPVNRPQNEFLAAGFTNGAYKVGGSSADYRIRFPDHWVFNGVGHDRIQAVLGYETDAADYVEENEGYPRVSGAEGTPLNTTVLATAELMDWAKPGRATMTLHSRNGTVFNAATTDWISQLGRDDAATRVTRNVFRKLKQRVQWNWEFVGHARDATAMTALDGILYLSTNANELWRRYPVGANVPWKRIDSASGVIAMAASGGRLFCVTRDNRLWVRDGIAANAEWRHIGQGPARGTRALAGSGGLLFAIDENGALHGRTDQPSSDGFDPIPNVASRPGIVAMSAYNGILFASTEDDRLLRTNRDLITESDSWTDIHHCNFSIGLAVVDWMLYVVTREDALWRIDLTPLDQP